MKFSEQFANLAKAMVKVQRTVGVATKQGVNPFFKHNGRAHRYADLAEVWEVARGPLTENGIAVVQGATSDGTKVEVTTRLIHVSGEWVEETIPLNPRPEKPKDQNGNVIREAEPFVTPQAMGSAITYGRRYGLAALVGIVSEDEDDDGNGASGHGASGGRRESARRGAPEPEPRPAGGNGNGGAVESFEERRAAVRAAEEADEMLYPVPEDANEVQAREWLLGRAAEVLKMRFPSRSQKDAKGRLEMIQKAFGVEGWAALTALPMTDLRRGLVKLDPPIEEGA